MPAVLKDAISQSGIANSQELATELLSGFGVVRDLIDQTRPEQWAGRPRNSVKDHIADFQSRDPVYNALLASLSSYDETQGTRFHQQFTENVPAVLARVQKLSIHHQIDPQQIQNVERAYVCILYMNTIEGVANPVRDTFLGSQAEIYQELLSEINQVEISRIRETKAYQMLLDYADLVARLDQRPFDRGAAWLEQTWNNLAPTAAVGEGRDFREDLGELKGELQSIAETLATLRSYQNGEKLTIEQEDSLATGLRHINERAGLRHLSSDDIVPHLILEGFGPRESLEYLMNLASVLEKGVAVPGMLREDREGRGLITLAANGAFSRAEDGETEPFRIAMRFSLEARMRADLDFNGAFERARQEKPIQDRDGQLKAQVYHFLHSVRDLGLAVPTAEVTSLGYRLKAHGLLNGQTTAILHERPEDCNPAKSYTFLSNLAVLADSKVNGVNKLHQAFGKNSDEHIGAFAEASVAVNLLANGHSVLAVRKVGPKSGHNDYDIVAVIDSVTYGIEVKSTVAALQQKNFRRDGNFESTQLNKLTRHARIDNLYPAVICESLHGMDYLVNSLADIWSQVEKLNDGFVPQLFDATGQRRHLFGHWKK